jgi:PKD repeat protein
MRKICALIISIMVVLVTIMTPSMGQDDEQYINPEQNTYRELDFFVSELPNSKGGGFEPHIIAGPGVGGSGEWYYIDSPTGLLGGDSGNLWISTDYGETWQFKPYGSNIGGSGDSYTVIAQDGTIYFTDLYLWTSTIDTSIDGGDTWIRNPLATVTRLGDRQWLRMGPTVNGLPGMQEETVYLIYNDIPQGLIIQRSRWTSLGLGWVMGNNRLPVSTSAGSRDYFAVDENDGTIYLPNKEEGNNIFIYVSSDGANSFTRYPVLATGEDIQNIFIAADCDSAGNVYLTWSSQYHIYLGVSQDRAATWSITRVTQTNGTRVLPWVVAGDPGRAALVWYDTPDEDGVSDQKEDYVNWSVQCAITIDALSDNMTFVQTPIIDYVHTGTISTGGLGGEADRDVGDFFTNDVDSKGRMIVTFGMDGDDGLNARNSAVMFGKQLEGPFILENVGPVAMFENTTNKLTVTVDASESMDQSGGGIVEYLWDWGDGTNGTGMIAEHTYNKSGEYTIQLKVVNEDDMRDSAFQTIDVKKPEVPMDLTFFFIVILFLIVGVAVYVYFMVYRKKNVVEVATIPPQEKPEVLPEAQVVPEALPATEVVTEVPPEAQVTQDEPDTE